MGAGLHGALPLVLYLPAPENNLPFAVHSLQFEPNIESVNRAARKEVADRSGSRNDINAYRVTATDDGRGPVEWRDDFRWRSTESAGTGAERLRLFSDGK
jgi:hypothetical protein